MAWLPQLLQVADYTPDMPDFNNPGSSNIVNVIPLTDQSYGPFAALAPYGNALTARCQGAFSCADSNGNNYVFAGDVNNLYRYTSASLTPGQISKSAGAYTTASDQSWNMLLFGQRVVATNFADPMQSYVMGSSSVFADLANGNISSLTLVAGTGYTPGTYALTVTGAGSGTSFAGTVTVNGGGGLASYAITDVGKNYPQTATIAIPAGAGAGSGGSITPAIQTIAPYARYATVAKGFLVCANTISSGINQPQRVWWSALNDPTNWPTPGTTNAAIYQSSYNDLYGAGGWITGVVGNLGGADFAVFMEHEVWRAVYAGPPQVFDFFPAEGVRGTRCPNSLVHVGPNVFYLGEDGFYIFDGSSSKPIGANRVDKTFYSNFDQRFLNNVIGAADPYNKVVYWIYPSTAASGGVPDSVLIYNWFLDRWSSAQVNCEYLLRSLSFGTTLNSMPNTLNSYSAPLDSRLYTGGSNLLAGFDSSHKLGYFSGQNLRALMETSESAPFNNKMAYITDARPFLDGGKPVVSLATRKRLVDTPMWNAGVSLNTLGTCPQRANGRYVRAQVVVPENSVWTHFQGVALSARPNGEQ